MVDLWVLTSDVLGGIGGAALAPLLWATLFVWAWSRPADAQASGFGRMTFWLLLPGALLASLADVPFLPWAGDVLAINVGGALIPVALTVLLLHRGLGVTPWSPTRTLLLLVAGETAVQFAVVLFAPSEWAGPLVLGVAGGISAFGAVVLPRWMTRPVAIRSLTFVSLTSVAIAVTFLTSQAVPGFGIESQFPLYLIAPALVGVAAPLIATTIWGVPGNRALGFGFGSATLGTLIGADVLREPPLYVGGGGQLLAIGGAGIQDLVYFSGLLALGAGLLFLVVRSRGRLPEGARETPLAPPPDLMLRSAAERLGRGDVTGAIRDSVVASEQAAQRVRTLYRLSENTEPAEAWDGLPVAPYVVNDYRNLVSAQSEPAPGPREGFRSLAMASQFVRLGRDLSRLQFARGIRRAWAAVIDLVAVTLPAVLLWVYLASTLPGTTVDVLTGLPFNLAVFGYVGYALLYYVVGDAVFGVSLGKRLLHLRVTNRVYARPTWMQSFLRESPKVVPLYAIGQLGAPAVLFVLRASQSSISPYGIDLALTGGVLVAFVILVVLVALAVGGIQVMRDAERRRLGDRWAATWVLDRRTVIPAWGATRTPSGAQPGVAPPA